VGASEPVAERTALLEPEGAPLVVRVTVVLPLAEPGAEADTLPLEEREDDTEELTQRVAVRDRDMDGGTVPVTVPEAQDDKEALGDSVGAAGVGVGAALAEEEGDAAIEGDAVLLMVGVTLVHTSTITTEPPAPAPPAKPPPTAGKGDHPTPLAV
jgi:hypothetical protein